ncbi:hypothetical protein [Bacillus cereus]|uniref:hypothetical protein n=1 Tax=Bacillus cereus TaxID=1396 RepID=UPI0021112AEA|nr:hypothetical protein [Bacillus cereus]
MNMAAGMIKIFLVFIGIFILSTLTMICFYFYNKSKEKKTNYLKALIGSLVGLIASLIGLTPDSYTHLRAHDTKEIKSPKTR